MLTVHSMVQRQNYLGYIDSQQKLTRTGQKRVVCVFLLKVVIF